MVSLTIQYPKVVCILHVKTFAKSTCHPRLSPSSQRFSRDLSNGTGPDSSYNLLQALATDSGYGSAHSIRSACSQNRYSGFPLPSNADMRHFSIDLYNNYESPSNRSSLSFNSAMLSRLSSRRFSLPLSHRLPR